MSIITYQPKRDWMGRFKPSKSRLAKIIFVLVALGSLALNYSLAKQVYNLRCEVNGEITGYFVKDETCGRIATARFELIEADRELRNIKEARAYENE